MQQAHLTAWQTHAPWPKRSQIEQDLRLARGVAAIFRDDVLSKHLAMRGGTVLHKAHLAPASRYSEDIDLVLTKAMPTDQLEGRLVRVLKPILGKPAPSLIADAWLTVRNMVKPSKILRITFEFVPLGLQRAEKIKVEVNLNEERALYSLVDVGLAMLDDEGDLVQAQVRSYDINEMMGTKTRALMQRKQGRDLFDLWYAWDMSQAGRTPYAVDGKKAMEAFEWYLHNEGGPGIGQAEANQKLDERLQDRGFRMDMSTLLRPGADTFDVDAAAGAVRTAFFAHLTGR